ncbi:Putative protease (plasmid) [Sinorhizobium meliloti 2011]|nr:Putative protease [Sinorhizobium meliloti 2011]
MLWGHYLRFYAEIRPDRSFRDRCQHVDRRRSGVSLRRYCRLRRQERRVALRPGCLRHLHLRRRERRQESGLRHTSG